MRYSDQPIVPTFLPVEQTMSHVVNEAIEQTPLIERLREGFPMNEFSLLLELFALPEEELGRHLTMSPATLQRRKKARKMTTIESERVVRLARLFGNAMEVFETKEAAREWLKTPNPGTAHESPLSYSDTEYGAREVENLLLRLDHGVFA